MIPYAIGTLRQRTRSFGILTHLTIISFSLVFSFTFSHTHSNTSFILSIESPMKEAKPLAAVGFTGIKDVSGIAICDDVGC